MPPRPSARTRSTSPSTHASAPVPRARARVAMLDADPRARAVSRSALIISALLCLIQSVPSLWDTLAIGKVADFPGGRAENHGSLTGAGGEMLARVTSGGASYARGIVDFTRRTGALGAGRRSEERRVGREG